MKNTTKVPIREASPTTPQPRIAVNVLEAAALLGISKNSMYAAVHAGAIPSLHLGRRYLIPLQALEEWGRGAASAWFKDQDRTVN